MAEVRAAPRDILGAADALCALYCTDSNGPKWRGATHRAHELLASYLTPGQALFLASVGSLTIRGGATGASYKVSVNGSASVLVEEGTRDQSWGGLCSAPSVPMPFPDRVLAVILMIRSVDGEQVFLENANPMGGYGRVFAACLPQILSEQQIVEQQNTRYLEPLVWCDPTRGWARVVGHSTIYSRRGVVTTHRFNPTTRRIEELPRRPTYAMPSLREVTDWLTHVRR